MKHYIKKPNLLIMIGLMASNWYYLRKIVFAIFLPNSTPHWS